jgi:hypothetical protein
MPFATRPTRGRYERPWHDGKAPDGFTINGWRRICAGGYVRFGKMKHYHAQFTGWVGQWVFVELDDCWGVNVNVWPDKPWVDTRALLACTNEQDWYADDPKAASIESRQRPKRVCN